MIEYPPSYTKAPPRLDDMQIQTVDGSQSISEPHKSHCEDRHLLGHAQWNCSKCRERLDDTFDETLRGSMLTYQGWSEKQIEALGSFRQFDNMPWTDLMPGPTLPPYSTVKLRAWNWSCLKELQARMDSAREYHQVKTAHQHLQNQDKVNLTVDEVASCRDSNGNELHPNGLASGASHA